MLIFRQLFTFLKVRGSIIRQWFDFSRLYFPEPKVSKQNSNIVGSRARTRPREAGGEEKVGRHEVGLRGGAGGHQETDHRSSGFNLIKLISS
jgi:hypothetical protein